MKRYIIVAALMAALLPTAAHAQDSEVKNYEFRLGWCGYPTADYEDFVVNSSNYYRNTSIEDMFSDYEGDTYMTGNIMAAFDFRMKKWLTFSIGVAANGIWKDIYDFDTHEKVRRENGCVVKILPQFKFTWFNREALRLYSAYGLGLSVGSFDGNYEKNPTGQVVFLGVSVGRKLVGFAELGSGGLYMGGMVGVGYRF